MTLAEYYDRQVPEYYPTMYMDGYTPDQILHAVHRKMVREYLERKAEKQAKKDAEVQIQKQVKKAIESSMKDLFKNWK